MIFVIAFLSCFPVSMPIAFSDAVETAFFERLASAMFVFMLHYTPRMTIYYLFFVYSASIANFLLPVTETNIVIRKQISDCT